MKRILIPVDGSEKANAALTAVENLMGEDTDVCLLRVVPALAKLVDKNRVREAENQLQEQLASWQEQGLPGSHRAVVKTGKPANQILQFADSEDISLILMTNSGKGGIGRWLLGKVAERVVRFAPCPTLVLKPEKPFKPSTDKKVVVPLDGSQLAELALEYTSRYFKSEMEMLLLQVVPPLALSLGEHVMVESQEYLQKIADEYREKMPTVEPKTFNEVGAIAEVIVDFCTEQEADFVVLTTTGLSGLKRWIIGGVAEVVIRKAPCAVFSLSKSVLEKQVDGPVPELPYPVNLSALREE